MKSYGNLTSSSLEAASLADNKAMGFPSGFRFFKSQAPGLTSGVPRRTALNRYPQQPGKSTFLLNSCHLLRCSNR